VRNCFTAMVCLALTMSGSTSRAQSSYPMIMSLSPAAAQVGTTSEHVVESRYSMYGAYQVLVTGDGVTGEVVTPMEPDKDGKEPSLTRITVRFTVTDDAMPGIRDFRVAGPTGASTLGQLVVTREPIVIEDPKNDTQETAQAITVASTVCGSVEKAEDVDFYRFTITQPTALTFHCLAMRIENKIHDLQTHVDPIITIRNATTGSTIAAADNKFAADPFLAREFEPGEYLLEVRDVRYLGNKYWKYCIEISDRPFVSNVHPFVVTAGQRTELKLIGSHLPDAGVAAFTAPSQDDPCGMEVTLPIGGHKSNPIALQVTQLPVVQESERDNNAFAVAQDLPLPGVVNGLIETPADIDCYVFEAAKGDRVSVEVVARRHWSGLDSIIRIVNEDGKSLVENDDLRLWNKRTVQDSKIENWAVPADGRYAIEIRDLHLRGGDNFVYSLKLTKSQPYFELSLDSDKTWLTPGSCSALFVRAVRKNGFDGSIVLHVDGLPDGVTATCGTILNGSGVDGCIVLEADSEAVPMASNIRVWGTAVSAAEGEQPVALRSEAQSMQEIYMPGGGRNHWPVEMHTVAVGSPSDLLDVTLSEYEVALKPGESKTIDVEIVRAAGFEKNVTLDMLFQHLSSKFANTLPPGVTIDAKKSLTLLTGANSKGAITLVAAKTAKPVVPQQCCVMANVSINFVMKATYSTRPLMVSVTTGE
jgi:hypothetical protein